MSFVIYTVPNCVYCVKAKELFKLNNIEYIEVLLEKNEFVKKVNEFIQGENLKTAPQITVTGKLIGGYTDLTYYLDNNSNSFNNSDDF